MGKRLGGDILETYEKKGYLLRDFRVFRLKDQRLSPIPFHYHDFHKIILFLGGHADYIIEGRSYPLVPRDIIFVSAGEIHRPVLSPDVPYERIVIYVAPAFLARCQKDGDDLAACFQKARAGSSVMHAGTGLSHDLLFHMEKLEHTSREEGFANGLYTEILFIEFMILLNRAMLAHELGELHASSYDEKIQQVLYNLVDNAIKFSHPDSSIRIETTERHSKIFVSVKDSGIGIPKEDQKLIFNRFYKTDLSRGKDKKGTGLGLSIVQEILRAHDENINVVSTENVGSEFIFSLRRSDVNDQLED